MERQHKFCKILNKKKLLLSLTKFFIDGVVEGVRSGEEEAKEMMLVLRAHVYLNSQNQFFYTNFGLMDDNENEEFESSPQD